MSTSQLTLLICKLLLGKIKPLTRETLSRQTLSRQVVLWRALKATDTWHLSSLVAIGSPIAVRVRAESLSCSTIEYLTRVVVATLLSRLRGELA